MLRTASGVGLMNEVVEENVTNTIISPPFLIVISLAQLMVFESQEIGLWAALPELIKHNPGSFKNKNRESRPTFPRIRPNFGNFLEQFERLEAFNPRIF
jgi:hypothetical protein